MADVGENEQPVLHRAVASGRTDEVEAVLTRGAVLEARDSDDWSALDRAAGCGFTNIVDVLLRHGADPTATGQEQRTPYQIALAAGHLAAARLLRTAEEARDPASARRHQWRPYCRAYLLSQVRVFPGWREPGTLDGSELAGDTVVFVQDDHTVTAGMWPGEDVILADVNPEWLAFCANELDFRVPDDFDLVPPATA
jgi:hypothetical protein